jgi:hypothetical protein
MPEQLAVSSTTKYEIERARSRTEGILALPVAGRPPQNVSLVRLHAPIEFEVVYWSATRRGGPPVVPSPKSLAGNPNRVFLGGTQSAIVPVPTFGGHWFCLAGSYTYVIVGPEGLDSNFYLGRMPWETVGVDENYIPAANFQNGIVSFQSQKNGQLPLDPDVQLLNAIQMQGG